MLRCQWKGPLKPSLQWCAATACEVPYLYGRTMTGKYVGKDSDGDIEMRD